MKKIFAQHKEWMLYGIFWVVMFLGPVIAIHMHVQNNSELTFHWFDIWPIWSSFTIYLLLFVIHNIWVSPLLVYKHCTRQYLAWAVTLVLAFTAIHMGARHFMRRPDARMARTERVEHIKPAPKPQLMFMGERDVFAYAILVLLFGMNLGIKYYFKNEEDRIKMANLEKKTVEQQLEYLKYQINPHFLMNTLNNIHTLIDIDTERAKETVIELSKMMRFVLYDGNKTFVSLRDEVAFLHNYISLMRLRYTDDLKVNTFIPDNLPAATIPPLLLITFVENAFKHGVSYRNHSFISISLNIDEQNLVFCCKNSLHDEKPATEGGVGLKNVQQRLNLLFGDAYDLDIDSVAGTYSVRLRMPLCANMS